MNKITQDIAEKDVKRWLDARRTSTKKIESMESSIKEMEGYVMDGKLIVDEDGLLTQILDFPIGEESFIKELKFKNRISVGDIQKRMTGNNVKSGDIDGRLMVYASALTDKLFAQIAKMDSSDYSVTSTVASFFF
jgi:hypothetical protein